MSFHINSVFRYSSYILKIIYEVYFERTRCVVGGGGVI